MILYHGSNIEVRNPKLLKNQRELDFGKGFYTTSDLDQARKWSKRTAARLRQQEGIVSIYEIDDTEYAKLLILNFEAANVKWLRLVAANRKGELMATNWDIISGPVANDQTMPVIDLYLDGMYNEEEAIKRLLPQKLKDQYAFKTEKAIQLLKFKEAIRI